MKINYIKKMNGKLTWKQIEHRDGLTFMRQAQRPLVIVKVV